MIIIAGALVPIILTILLGYGIKRSGKLAPEFWLGTESLTYYILTPALLISILSNRTLSELNWLHFLSALLFTVLLSAGLLIAYQRLCKPFSAAGFTSVFQGGVRYNTFIALALVAALYGDEGLSYAALAATGMIILINVLCVAVFASSLSTQGMQLLPVLKQIISNPLIIGALSGILLNISGIGLHPILVDTLDLFGRSAFPMGLILVGAALSFKGLLQHWKLVLSSAVVQYLIKPICALGAVMALDIEGVAAMVSIIFLCVPTAPAAYILARKLGGDAQAMAAIITSQTVMGFITLPLTIYWAARFIGPI